MTTSSPVPGGLSGDLLWMAVGAAGNLIKYWK